MLDFVDARALDAAVKATTDRRIGRAAIVVTAALALMLGVTAAVALWPRGDVELPAGWYSQSDYTVIIFGRTSCAACATSADFHRALAAAAEARGIRAVAALTARDEAPADFATSIGIQPDHAVLASPAPPHLTTVPTVIVTNRRGTILKKLEGALSVEDQRGLVNFLTTLR